MDKETIMQLLADGVISNEAAARYFPELKENEDERIRKEILDYIVKATGCKRWIAWIEKQGEQKVEVKYVYTKFRIGDVIVEIKPNGYCQPVTVKHVGKWAYSCESDDGKRSLSFPITSQDQYKLVEQKPTDKCEGCNNVKGCVACVDGSEWAHIEEQDSAWSERDDSNIERAIWYIENPAPMVVKDSMLVFWLKSLKERIQPQNTWKPSEHELEVLKLVAEKDGTCLMGLYKQLKKLKE